MATLNLEPEPKLPEFLRLAGLLPTVTLFDVGVSGGLAQHFRVFGNELRAIGFDPLVAEIRRLNREETNPNVQFEAAYVGCNGYDDLLPDVIRQNKLLSKDNTSFPRTSAARALALMSMNYDQAVHNQGEPLQYTDARYSLDQYVNINRITDATFLKIDTDGHDLEVLIGATNTLRECRILGVEVEVVFHGIEHPHANVFHNIDKLMRQAGFTLFDLEIWRYSRGALPARFRNNFPAQTVAGSIQWGDALYFRDLADPDYTLMHDFRIDRDKILTLCCLFELYSLPDCSAELLLQATNGFELDLPYTKMLDILTPDRDYRDYISRFERNPMTFCTP